MERGLVDGLKCVDDRFHRVAVVFCENPVGVILPAFDSIAKDTGDAFGKKTR